MVINLWHNSAMDQWRWTLSDPKTLDQHSGTQKDIRIAIIGSGKVSMSTEFFTIFLFE